MSPIPQQYPLQPTPPPISHNDSIPFHYATTITITITIAITILQYIIIIIVVNIICQSENTTPHAAEK